MRLSLLLVILAGTALAQVPPYIRGPLTTNTPSGQTNAVLGIVSPGGVFTSVNGIYFPHASLPLYVYNFAGGFYITSPNASVGGFRLLSYQDDCYFQNTSTGRMVFSGSAGAAAAGNFIFNTASNVGIGTMDPKTKLSVVGVGSFGGLVATNAIVIREGTEPAAIPGSAQFYSADNAGISEMFVQGDDGVQTQISPHASDAPGNLYDRGGGMKEMVLREVSPFLTNGMVSFINMRRLAKITELNTKAILYLSGQNNSGASNALRRLQDMSPAQRAVLITETFAEYNTRTGKNLQVKVWEAEENSRQAAYNSNRLAIQQQYDSLVAAGVTNSADLPAVPPNIDIRRARPFWLQ